MKDVNIISIGPPHIYVELVNGIVLSLLQLGFNPHAIYYPHSTNTMKSDCEINFVITGRGFIPNRNHINFLIETEQNHVRRDPELPEQYENYTKILHIFKEQECLTKNSQYFPIGYSKSFASSIKAYTKYSIVHFGQVIPGWRRSRLLEKFNVHNINEFGEKRDKVINSADINVIFRKHEKYYFTPIHALLILCKGKLLLQEQCEEYGIYKDCIIEFTEDTYEDIVEYWLRNKDKRNKMELAIRDHLKVNHNLTKYIEMLGL